MLRARSATFNGLPKSCVILSVSAREAASRSAVSSRRWHRISRNLSSEAIAAFTDDASPARYVLARAERARRDARRRRPTRAAFPSLRDCSAAYRDHDARPQRSRAVRRSGLSVWARVFPSSRGGGVGARLAERFAPDLSATSRHPATLASRAVPRKSDRALSRRR